MPIISHPENEVNQPPLKRRFFHTLTSNCYLVKILLFSRDNRKLNPSKSVGLQIASKLIYWINNIILTNNLTNSEIPNKLICFQAFCSQLQGAFFMQKERRRFPWDSIQTQRKQAERSVIRISREVVDVITAKQKTEQPQTSGAGKNAELWTIACVRNEVKRSPLVPGTA